MDVVHDKESRMEEERGRYYSLGERVDGTANKSISSTWCQVMWKMLGKVYIYLRRAMARTNSVTMTDVR